MLRLTRIPALVALGAALALAGCGDDDESSSNTPPPPPYASPSTSGGAQALELTADKGGALKFDKTSLSAKPGAIELVMVNPSQIPHDIGVEGKGVDEEGPVVERGGTSTVSVNLKPGTYEFYCSVGSHREAGMKGTLTVR